MSNTDKALTRSVDGLAFLESLNRKQQELYDKAMKTEDREEFRRLRARAEALFDLAECVIKTFKA